MSELNTLVRLVREQAPVALQTDALQRLCLERDGVERALYVEWQPRSQSFEALAGASRLPPGSGDPLQANDLALLGGLASLHACLSENSSMCRAGSAAACDAPAGARGWRWCCRCETRCRGCCWWKAPGRTPSTGSAGLVNCSAKCLPSLIRRAALRRYSAPIHNRRWCWTRQTCWWTATRPCVSCSRICPAASPATCYPATTRNCCAPAWNREGGARGHR